MEQKDHQQANDKIRRVGFKSSSSLDRFLSGKKSGSTRQARIHGSQPNMGLWSYRVALESLRLTGLIWFD